MAPGHVKHPGHASSGWRGRGEGGKVDDCMWNSVCDVSVVDGWPHSVCPSSVGMIEGVVLSAAALLVGPEAMLWVIKRVECSGQDSCSTLSAIMVDDRVLGN